MNRYTSPFHLLPTRNTHVLTADGLKRWKKELMLQFDLNQNAVIDIDGKEYDKNDILQVFDLLKDRPDFHLRLYQNKPLLNFIEKGDVSFFEREKNWEDFWDTSYRDWVGQWFIPAYDSMVYGLVEDKSFQSLEALRNLQSSKFHLPESWGYEAHQKAFRHLSQFIEKADVALDNMPPAESPRIELQEKIREYVDMYYANLLKILPEQFEGLRRQYGNFAHNVIASIFYKERKFKDIERGSLITLRDAARIDIEIRDDDYSKGLLPLIEQYLLGERQTSSKEKSNYWLWILFVVAIFALRVCRHMPSNNNEFANTTIINYDNIDYFKEVKKYDLIGVWNAVQSGNITKKLTFVSDSSGTMVALIQNPSTQEVCKITGEFTWTLINSELDVYYKNIQLVEDFTQPNSVDDLLKSKVLDDFSESLKVHAKRVDNTVIVKRLTNKEVTYKRDAPVQFTVQYLEFIAEKERYNRETAYVMSRYDRSKTAGEFDIERGNDGNWYAYYDNEKVMIAESKMYYGKYAFVSLKWAKKQGNWSKGGRFKDIRYTDANNRTHIGDLEMYFTLVDGLQVKFKAGTQGLQADNLQEIAIEETPPPPPPPSKSKFEPTGKLSATPLELPKMMSIPAGTFTMGCTAGDKNCNSDEKPAHKVTLDGFRMSRYEITNAQYCVFLNEKKKHNGTKIWVEIDHTASGITLENEVYSPKPGKEHQPVVKVTWYGATSYCLWLSKKTGKKYRLPTEAQWEYAARGGTSHIYAGSSNVNRVACYYENTRQICAVNSTRKPNGYGLYDMSGNVWEWCADWYKEKHYAKKTSPQKGPSSGSKRVLRGGAWTEDEPTCRVSHRSWYYPTYSSNNLGFRCVVNE